MATFTVSTKPSKTGAEVKTVVTMVYDNPTAERALATQAAIVKAQGGWRKHGIPAQVTLKLSELAPGTRSAAAPITVESIKAMAPTFTPEQKAALIALLK